MRNLFRTTAVLLALHMGVASAQQFPNLPSGTVIGRSQIGAGPAQAIPFSSLIAAMLAGPLTLTTVNVNSVVFKGSISGQATLQAQAAAGAPALNLPTVSGTIPSSAAAPIVIDPVTGIVSCPTCVTSVAAGSPIIASRAAGQALNLSSFAGIVTAGYAAAGDGGGATFKNVGTAPFVEQSVQSCGSIVGGSGYSGGPFLGVPLTGSATGYNVAATVTLSGTNVSAVAISNWGGNKYVTGDVLSVNNSFLGGSGTGFQCTVTANAALGSFVDSVGTHFQIVNDPSGTNNVLQFGVKMDYVGSDGSATDNTASLFNALQYAGNTLTPGKTVDAGGAAGARLIAPAGSALICPSTKPFQIPFGVRFEGANIWATTFKLCDSFANTGQEIFDLCDPQSHLACFGTQMSNMTLYANGTPVAAASAGFVFSNNIQQVNALYRVAIYSGNRSCIVFSNGYGGAAWVGIEAVECTPWPGGTNPGINLSSYGSTVIKIKDSFVETGGSGTSLIGVQISPGGFLDIDGFHTEGLTTGIFSNITGSTASGSVRIHNATGGAHCTNLYLKQGSSVVSSIVGTSQPNGCTNTINNGGSVTTTPVIADTAAF